MEVLPEFYLKFTLAGINHICRLLNLQLLSFPFQIGDHVSLIIPNQDLSFLFFKHLPWLVSHQATYRSRWLYILYLQPKKFCLFCHWKAFKIIVMTIW